MKKVFALGIVIVILVTATTVWAHRRRRLDPEVGKIMQQFDKAEQLPEDQRRAMRGDFRTTMERLNPSQQQQLREQMGIRFERRANAQAAAYCGMTADQKRAYLDQQVAEMQKRQQEWESRRAAEQAQNGTGAQDGGSGRNGGGPGGGGPGGGPGGRGNRFDQQAQAQRRNQRLDNSSPEQRAQRNAYVQDLRAQCQAAGVTPPRFGGGR